MRPSSTRESRNTGDREFLYFVRAFRWATTSETPFVDFADYPRGEPRDHFFSDQYRALFAVITDRATFPRAAGV